MMKSTIFVVLTLICVIKLVSAAIVIPEGCKDKLNSRRFVQAFDNKNQLLYNFTDCNDLTHNLPELCEIYGGMGNFCCEACYDVDSSCLDTKLRFWVLDEKDYDCPAYVALDTCNCMDSVVSESCCKSCLGKDLSNCGTSTCRDTLTADNPIQMTFGSSTIKLDNCTDMAEDFGILCIQFGQEHGMCCHSCQDVDLECFNKLIAFDGQMCNDYIDEDPCRCKQVVNGLNVSECCCKSCTSASRKKQDCCRDDVTADDPLQVLDPTTGNTVAVLTSCDEVINHISLCSNETVKGELGRCCKWCKEYKEKYIKGCADNPIIKITQGGSEYTCSEFVALDDPCNCLDIPNAKVDCCASCKGKDMTGCKCRDLLSIDNPLTFNGTDLEITSCDQLLPDHPDLCKQLSGKGKACCRTCASVDTKCVDDSLIKFTTPDKVERNCASYIAADVCNCLETKKCCASCKGKNTSHCKCYNSVSTIYPLNIESEDGIPLGTVTSCDTIIDLYPSQCAHSSIAGKNGKCCEACKAVPHPNCLDARQAAFTINNLTYNCEELISFSMCFCQDTLDGIDVNDICCASCRRKDLSMCKCRDMVRAEIPVQITDQSGSVIDTVRSCTDLVDNYPDQCITASGRGGVCCQSCKAVPNPTCLDLLKTPVELDDGNILTTCPEIAERFPELCRRLGGDGNLCCRSCKSIKTDCLNTRLKKWQRAGNIYNCTEWVKLDVCNCEDSTVAESCCRACKTAQKDLKKINCACRNYLHTDHAAKVTLVVGNIDVNVTSCSQVKNNFPWLCRKSEFQELCCATCSSIDTRCLNDNVGFNGATLTCDEFVALDKCNCAKTVSGINVGEACCQSCKRKDTSKCGCRNTVNEENPITFSDGYKLTSCKSLQGKNKKLCELFGKPEGRCCAACAGVDTGCADDPLVIFSYKSDPSTTYKCPGWIKEDHCHCHNPETKKKCCVSCLMKNTNGCGCRDSVSQRHPIVGDMTDKNNVTTRVVINSCVELKSKFQHHCPQFGGPGNLCCITCPDPCQNKANWVGDLGKSCRACTCASTLNRKLRKKACCFNFGGYRDNCCPNCKKVKC